MLTLLFGFSQASEQQRTSLYLWHPAADWAQRKKESHSYFKREISLLSTEIKRRPNCISPAHNKTAKGHKAASSAGFFVNQMANVWILDVNECRGDILEWLQQEIKKQNGVRSDSLYKCWVWYLAFYFQQVWLCSVSLWFLHKEKKWSDMWGDWTNSSTQIHTRMHSLWFYFHRRGFSIQSP